MKYIYLKITVMALFLGVLSVASSAQAHDGKDKNEAQCREFTRNIIIDGQKEKAYGTACLQPNGAWKIVRADDDLAHDDNAHHVKEKSSKKVVVIKKYPHYGKNYSYKYPKKQYRKKYGYSRYAYNNYYGRKGYGYGKSYHGKYGKGHGYKHRY